MLYVVQHGVARPPEEDPERPLSEAGAEEVRRVARAAAEMGLAPRRILHSDRLRARQTAEILGEALAPPEGLVVRRHLGPEDDVARLAAELHDERNLMVVGHLPYLERLITFLVTGETEPVVLRLRNAGIAALGRVEGEGRWVVLWTLYPGICC